MTIRALLVDDEELARRGLKLRLERMDDISVIGECSNGREALDAITRLVPDVVFLDIQMPGMSGLDVAAALSDVSSPYVIFVTGFNAYAARAFEVDALDYILKPYDDQRLADAVARARRVLAPSGDPSRRLDRAVAEMQKEPPSYADAPALKRLMVRTGDRTFLVRVDEIDWVEASGDYVSLHVGKKKWLLREPIGDLAERFVPHGIVRIHRSTLVNLDRIHELRPLGKGDLQVVLRDGTELTMSRTYRSVLDELTGLSA